MIDFHTHLLPGMDDGSKSPQESVQMLQMLQQQGVISYVATPHFYPNRETPEHFLERRRRSSDALAAYMGGHLSQLRLGAEVSFFSSIGHSKDISALCIEGTRTILVEMPFTLWDDRTLQEVLLLRDDLGLSPVLAHVERYLDMQSSAMQFALFHCGLPLQISADVFLSRRTRRNALKLVEKERVHLLGSDCHGVDYRPPHMGAAAQVIVEHLGKDVLLSMENNARRLLTSVGDDTL